MVKSKYISDIINLLLDGDDEAHKAKHQIKHLTDIDYEYTDSGVFIGFTHDNGIENKILESEKVILAGLIIKSNEPKLKADATLFFKNGLINYLEIWCFEGKYPERDLIHYELSKAWDGSINQIIKNK